MHRVITGLFRVPARGALLAFLSLFGTFSGAATPGTNTRAEIAHLLAHLETSGCEFYRNGAWHEAGKARAHLEKKMSYLMNRALIGSAEDFIELAATSSSVSGATYRVRCPSGAAVRSDEWLRAELERYRAATGQHRKASAP